MDVAADVCSVTLKSKIETRMSRIGIIGMGYVGLPCTLLYSIGSFLYPALRQPRWSSSSKISIAA
jgi:hypothetical protein